VYSKHVIIVGHLFSGVHRNNNGHRVKVYSSYADPLLRPSFVGRLIPRFPPGAEPVSRGSHLESTASSHEYFLPLDLFLQLEQSIEQRLGAGRTARHIDIDRDNLVDALNHRVTIVVIA
jgi:hypothetical protein